jgi:hypothetical protein
MLILLISQTKSVFYHVDSHSKELIALCPDILLMPNRPVSKPFCETKSRDVIENRPLTKENPTSGKVRDDSIVVLAINNPACSIITAS